MINVGNELVPGTLLQKRYRIEKKAGGGNMGVVYQAVDLHLQNRSVAIKEMRWPDPAKGGLDTRKAVRLFKQEAAILSGLNHKNLPHVYGSFQENGTYYLVMDFIEGQTLSQKMKTILGQQPLDVRDTVNYAIQLCDILDYLHGLHPPVIFRDLKPSNVMVDQDGRVFLVDFGIARHFKPSQTGDTVVIGTRGYADPESSQINQTNPRSDLYGLGATLHHCLTARVPSYEDQGFRFPAASNFNHTVPAKLNQIIMRLVEPQSINRPASAREVKQELLAIQTVFQGLNSAGMTGQVDSNALTEADDYNQPTVISNPLAEFLKSLAISFNALSSGIMTIASPIFGTLFQGFLLLGSLLWRAVFLLFSMLFVAGKLLAGILLSPVTHRRVQDIWQQAQQGSQKVLQQSRQGGKALAQQAQRVNRKVQQVTANWSWTWLRYSPVWRPRFLALLVSLLALMIVASIYLLRVFHNSLYVVDLCLSLLLVFVVFITRSMMSDVVPRRILTASGLLALASLLAQLLASVVGKTGEKAGTSLPAQPPTFSTLLTWILLVLALLALASGFMTSISQVYQQPVRWRGWIDRLALFTLAATWTLLQYLSGSTEHIPFTGNTGYPLATRIIQVAQGQGTFSLTVNQLLCLPLALCTLLLLLRTKERLTVADRRLLLLIFLPYLVLQWSDGTNELLHFFPTLSPLTAAGANVVLFLILIVAIFVLQRPELDRFDLIDHVALLVLMAASAAFQQAFNTGTQTFLTTPLPRLTISLALEIAFIVIGILLIFPLKRRQGSMNRVLFSTFVVACAVMEFAYGQAQSQSVAQTVGGTDPTQVNAVAVADLHRFLAFLLVLTVVAATMIALIRARRTALPQGDTLERWQGVGDRAMTLGAALVSFLLLLAFTGQSVLLPYLTHVDVLMNRLTTRNAPTFTLTALFLLLACLLLLFSFIAFIRLFRFAPLDGKDRVIFLVADATCLLLLSGTQNVSHLSLLTASTQEVFGGAFPLFILNPLQWFSIAGAGLVSLFWLRRPFTTADRIALSIVFLAAVLFGIFQPIHSQLFLALLTLVLATLIAAQMERVRIGTRVI